MTNDIPIHPAAEAFPLLEGDQLDDLVSNIREHGLQVPIVLDEGGALLDGRNRLQACKLANVEPEFTTYDGDDPVGFILQMNVRRRHLNPGQRAFAALALMPHFETEAADRRAQARGEARGTKRTSERADLPAETGRARDAAAKAVGTSGRAVAQAKRVHEKAPHLAEKVRAGTLSLNAAERQVARGAREERERGAREAAVFETQASDASGNGWMMLQGTFRDRLSTSRKRSLAAIVTELPYTRRSLPRLSALAEDAVHLLDHSGVLIVATGLEALPDVIKLLDEHLSYCWIYSQPLPGQRSRIMGGPVLETWRPWLIYSKVRWRPVRIDQQEDAAEPSVLGNVSPLPQDGTPAAYLTETFTRPGDYVCDPAAGVGTYGEVVVQLGRYFIGCEADPNQFESAVARLRAAEGHETG